MLSAENKEISSFDGVQILSLANYPYVKINLTKIQNPFAMFLYCMTGKVDTKIYQKELENFRKKLVSVNSKYKKVEFEHYRSKTPHSIFKLNADIPQNSYAFTLTEGRFQTAYGNGKKNLIDEILKEALNEEKTNDDNIFLFLAEYFNVSFTVVHENFLGGGDGEIREMYHPERNFLSKKITFVKPSFGKIYIVGKQAADGSVMLI